MRFDATVRIRCINACGLFFPPSPPPCALVIDRPSAFLPPPPPNAVRGSLGLLSLLLERGDTGPLVAEVVGLSCVGELSDCEFLLDTSPTELSDALVR